MTEQPVLKTPRLQVEGVLRQRVQKWGQFEDVALRAILREEWPPYTKLT